MPIMEFQVQRQEAGLAIEEFLQRRLPAAPPGYLAQLLRSGKVRSGTESISAGRILSDGERLRLPESRRLHQIAAEGEARELEILRETGHLMVVEKPSGLAVHSALGHEEDNLTRRVQRLVAERREPFGVAPVHRLDLETSGPVLFGKGRKATARLGALFMEGAVRKDYLALVAGPLEGQGRITAPVLSRGKRKEAATSWRSLSGNSTWTLLDLRLETGRTHQIRRHLSALGHPLAGDRRYRGASPPGLNRLFLHCRRLALTDPWSAQPLIVTSPLPSDLAALLQALGIEFPGEV